MEICWDNLEGVKLTRNGVFIKNNTRSYVYKCSCCVCGEPYLTEKYNPSKFCSRGCAISGKNHPWYGKHLSDKHKHKLSAASIGNKNHFYGKHHSNKTKKLISQSKFGKSINKDQFGNKNPNWRGGITNNPYCVGWTKDYKEEIKERDGYMCLNPYCFHNDGRLHVHHVDYIKTLCGPSNLITLCGACNTRANYDRKWHIQWYRTILNRRYGYEY